MYINVSCSKVCYKPVTAVERWANKALRFDVHVVNTCKIKSTKWRRKVKKKTAIEIEAGRVISNKQSLLNKISDDLEHISAQTAQIIQLGSYKIQ